MKVFLIILAVLAVLFIALLNLSATFTVIYDKGWRTTISVLFINKDIELSKLLSFLLFPEKRAQKKARESKDGSEEKPIEENTASDTDAKPYAKSSEEQKITEKTNRTDEKKDSHTEAKTEKSADGGEKSDKAKPQKSNPIAKIWNDEGIAGILSLLANVLQSANSAILTLIRGLHIYSLYVMIIVGGADAASIAQKYGSLCSYYYPVKGLILSNMKVDHYDDVIQPDFLADVSEFEMQFIGSISVGLLLKVALRAAAVFLKNIIKDKKIKKSK